MTHVRANAQHTQLISDSNEAPIAGIVISFSEVFWNNLLKGLIPQIFKKLKETVFEGGSTEIKIKDMLVIYFTVEDFNIDQLAYDLTNTRVDLFEDNNTIGAHIARSNFSAHVDYLFDLDPSFITDNGTLDFSWSDLGIDFVFGIGDGQDSTNIDINVTTSSFNLNPEKVNLTLVNENNFNQLVSFLMTTVQAPVINVISKAFTEYLGSGINAGIHLVPNPITIGNMTFNNTLVEAANITAMYTSNKIVGSFTPIDRQIPIVNNVTLPTWDEKGQSLQIYLSEFVFQSLLYSLFDLGQISLMLEESPLESLLKFDTDSFAYFLPTITKVFGKGKPTRISIAAVEAAPSLNIDSKGLNVDGKFDLGVDVFSDGSWKNAMVSRVQAKFIAKVEIFGNLRLSVSISSIEFELTEIIQSNIGEINIRMIDNLLGTIETIIKYAVNAVFTGKS